MISRNRLDDLLDRTFSPLLALPGWTKRSVVIATDISLCVLTVWIAMYLRLGEWVSLSERGWPAALASILIAVPIFTTCGLYRTVFRFIGWEALVAIAQALLIYGLFFAALFTAWGVLDVPRTVGLIQPVLLFLAVGGTRVFVRYWLGGMYRKWFRAHLQKNVVIYGAGSAGLQLAQALSATSWRVVGFVDDNPALHLRSVAGKRIWLPTHLRLIVKRFQVEEIFLAIPSASRNRRNEILAMIRETGVGVRTLPGLLDIAAGKVSVSDLQPLSIEDLLCREVVPPDCALIGKDVAGEVVLVTGAGGSIGSELCRQILALRPRRLVLVETSEFALYSIHRELLRLAPDGCEMVAILGSVTDESRMRAVFAAFRPATVYHAAAFKHVPLVEHNIVDGVRNNAIGTLICGRLARHFGVNRFVLISTDKAVRPTNVMGASKRLAEMCLQALAAEQSGHTRFTMVRFGNVLGSSGSVVPLFRQQIAAGGPVSVTHREVIRYFMTIPEAAQLVLHAGALAQGGEVYVLDMGEPVRIHDLAVRMIELSGMRVRDENNPDGDIAIEFTGLRPGEKLYEELLIGADPIATDHPRIMKANESFLPAGQLFPMMDELAHAAVEQDLKRVIRLLCQSVPEYQPSREIVDVIHLGAQRADRPRLAIIS